MSIAAAIEAVAGILGPRLASSAAIRAAHGDNEAHFPSAPPDAVAFPESAEEVAAILGICDAELCPVVAYGAASSLEGQHLAVRGGISLDTGRMNRLLEVRAEDLCAVVQPGLTREALNAGLRATGLFFPVDPGADASLGGMAATRASGTTAVRYGTMRENVLALQAAMADGTLIRTGTAARKSAAGYDLTHLLVGSEGTLGIITELTLRLQGIPEAVSAATCRFETVADAVAAVILTIQSGIPMARIELVDGMMARGFNLHSGGDLPEKPHLFVEFRGSPAAVAEEARAFGEIAAGFGAAGFAWSDREEERAKLWRLRHNAHYAAAMLAPGKRTLATDICVPISNLAEAITLAQDEAARLGLVSAIVGHVGDGNFHCAVRFDPADSGEVGRVEDFAAALAGAALRLGGTVTGEHGIGLGKLKYMAAQHGPALARMRAIKAAFDPNDILNPGKMLPPGNR